MIEAVEVLVDFVKGRLRRRYHINRLQIVTYPGFRNHSHVFVRGRVLVGKDIEGGGRDHSVWRNFANMAKRFLSAEIPHARIEVCWQGQSQVITTDHEGFFFEKLPCHPDKELDLTIRSAEPGMIKPYSTEPRVIPLADNSRFAVVSDIDDTVLLTMANKAIRMVALTLFGNAHTRQPFAGVSGWYRMLKQGVSGAENPLFYVSSSPWNLYDFLEEFLDVNEIPMGPMFLKNHGLKKGRLDIHDHRGHKIEAVISLLEAFPGRNFLLIGDSGQKDPEIYREIVGCYPGRIIGVMIRNVTQLLPLRVSEVERLGREIEEHEVRFLMFDRTDKAAQATREWGLTESQE